MRVISGFTVSILTALLLVINPTTVQAQDGFSLSGENASVTNFKFDKETYDITETADTVRITFQLSTTSDFSAGLIYFKDPNGDMYSAFISNQGKDKRIDDYEVDFELIQYHQYGDWEVDRIFISQSNGSESIRPTVGHVPGFSVAGSVVDLNAPTYANLALDSRVLDIGNGHQYVTIQIDIEDDLSGLQNGLVYVRPYGAEGSDFLFKSLVLNEGKRISGDNRTGTYSGQIKFEEDDDLRTWHIYRLSLIDNIGNSYHTTDLDTALYSIQIIATEDGPVSPDVAELVSPINRQTGLPRNVQLQFNQIVDHEGGYIVQASTDSTFQAINFQNIISTNSNPVLVDLNNLGMGDTYYWRVRGRVGFTNLPWSKTFRFTVNTLPDEAPELVPIEFPGETPLNQVFVWNRTLNTESYNIRLTNTQTSQAQLFTTSDTTYTFETLRPVTNYSIEMQSINNVGTSLWSSPTSFITELVAPLQVNLINPLPGAVTRSPNVVFEWEQAEYASSYTFQLAVDSTFAESRVDTLLLEGSIDVSLPDSAYGMYFWRVRGENIKGSGPWSAVNNLEYEVTPIAQKPTFRPEPGEYTGTVTVTLSSDTPEARIYYTLDGSEPTSDSILYESNLTLTGPDSLTVRAIAVADGFRSSEVVEGTYIVDDYPLTAAPTFTPEPGEYTGPLTVTLSSSTAEARIFYTLDGSVPDTTSIEYLESFEIIGPGAVEVKGIAVAEGHRLSEVADGVYVINSTTIQQENPEIPLSVNLDQNYPNPFNPTTQIKYSLPESMDVHLEVFAMSGQRVSVLASGNKSAGYHSVIFDAQGLSSGLYLYRLTTPNATYTRSMMLIK